MLQVRTACPGHDLRQVARRDIDQPHQLVLGYVEPVQKLSHPVRVEFHPRGRAACARVLSTVKKGPKNGGPTCPVLRTFRREVLI